MPILLSRPAFRFRRSLIAGACLAFSFSASMAQQTKPEARPAPVVSATPEVTTAQYGAWVLRCQSVQAQNAARQCEISQSIQVQGQNAPVAQYGLSRSEKGKPWRFAALLPVNIQFPSTVKLATGAKPPLTAELAWQRCIPAGCVAALDLAAAMLAALRGTDVAGTVTFIDASGRNIVVPIEFRGLAQAMDAY